MDDDSSMAGFRWNKQLRKLLGKRIYMTINLQTNVEGRGGALFSPQGFPCSMPHDKV